MKLSSIHYNRFNTLHWACYLMVLVDGKEFSIHINANRYDFAWSYHCKTHDIYRKLKNRQADLSAKIMRTKALNYNVNTLKMCEYECLILDRAHNANAPNVTHPLLANLKYIRRVRELLAVNEYWHTHPAMRYER